MAATDTMTGTETAPAPTTAPATTAPAETVADWRAGLTGEHATLAQDKTLANIKGKDWTEAGPTLAKMLVESQRLVGKKTEGMLKVPGKDAKPEEIAAFREALGVPKAPSDYEVKLPADAPEGLKIDPERFAGYAKVFHQMNLSNDQVNGIIGWAMKEEATRQAQQREQFNVALDALADQWGVDVFNRRAGEVQSLVRKFADPETIAWLDQTGLTNHPGLFKMLHPIAREFAESGIIEPVGESVASDMQSLQQRLDANREAYLKAPETGPQRNQLLAEREKLLNTMQEMMPAAR